MITTNDPSSDINDKNRKTSHFYDEIYEMFYEKKDSVFKDGGRTR